MQLYLVSLFLAYVSFKTQEQNRLFNYWIDLETKTLMCVYRDKCPGGGGGRGEDTYLGWESAARLLKP